MEGWGSGGPPERNLRKGIRRGRRKDLEDPATPAAEPYIEGKGIKDSIWRICTVCHSKKNKTNKKQDLFLRTFACPC